MTQPKTGKTQIKANNPGLVKEAIALGKKIYKEPDATKSAAAMKIYEMIKDEEREIVVGALIDGASLTPKGAMTYYYNCRRKSITKA
jgi:hypothetical protein